MSTAAKALFAFLMTVGVANAAEIVVKPVGPGQPAVVEVRGELNADDDRLFVRKVLELDQGLVLFDSPGGNLFAGIGIGRAIHLKEFNTLVDDGALCASACALAWLGGASRFMGSTAKVGFHAAYEMEGGKALERGAANAVVGAYLSQLGLSQSAVFFLTTAPPESMSWLSAADALRFGIQLQVLAPRQEAFGHPAQLGDQTSRRETEPKEGPAINPSPSSAVAQRAIFYAQGSDGAPGPAYQGTVTWSQTTRPDVWRCLRK